MNLRLESVAGSGCQLGTERRLGTECCLGIVPGSIGLKERDIYIYNTHILNYPQIFT
ncbi:hypothetical protein HanIR_Chr11g0509821 [Helianthus annuus]|nr:hypothetical protein HanIR_Chr11g0509821 [Helianthus annuus]